MNRNRAMYLLEKGLVVLEMGVRLHNKAVGFKQCKENEEIELIVICDKCKEINDLINDNCDNCGEEL